MQQSLALFGMNEEIKRKKNAKKIIFCTISRRFYCRVNHVNEEISQIRATYLPPNSYSVRMV